MTCSTSSLAFVTAWLVVSAAGSPLVGAATAPSVAQEVARLRTLLAVPPDNDDLKQMAPSLKEALDRVDGHQQDGRIYAAVDGIEYVRTSLEALAFMAREAPKDGGQLMAFEVLWKATAPELGRDEKAYERATWSRTPAAVRAVAESAFGRSRHLYQAALAYAEVTSPGAGYYYMGESRGSLGSALYVRSLGLRTDKAPVPARSLGTEIAALSKEIESAYKPPRSIDRHRDFIRTNASVKLATELDSAGLYHGALLAYVKAVRTLGEIEGTIPPATEKGAIEGALADAHKALAEATRDESIGLVLVESAQGGIAGAANAAAEGEALRAARMVLDRALPAYRTALEPTAPAQRVAEAAAVRVTLVRWPYT
jgi:hypothetical protein